MSPPPHGPRAQTGAPRWQRLLPPGLAAQFSRFVVVGVLATVVYFGAYNLARIWLEPFTANGVAVAASVVVNFGANRRWTFQIRGAAGRVREALQFLAVLALTFAVSTGGLVLLFAFTGEPGRTAENAALLIANGALFVVRFWLLRSWVFASHQAG